MTTSTQSAPQSYTGIVGPGQTLPVAVVGTQFYFPVASGQLWARQSGGLWALFVQGTGQDCGAQFTQVEINNPGTSPLVFQIVASANDFKDHRLVQNVSTPNVVNAIPLSAWTASGSDWRLSVPDLSGQQFNDANGTAWIAIQRVSLTVQNITDVLLDVIAGSTVTGTVMATLQSPSGGPIIDPFIIPASGNFFLAYGPAGSADVQVFEIYQAVKPGFAANPPN